MRRQNTRFSVLTEDAMRPHRRLSDVSNVSNVSIVTRHSYISQGTRHSNVSRNTHGLTQDELREAARQDREERAQREWESLARVPTRRPPAEQTTSPTRRCSFRGATSSCSQPVIEPRTTPEARGLP